MAVECSSHGSILDEQHIIEVVVEGVVVGSHCSILILVGSIVVGNNVVVFGFEKLISEKVKKYWINLTTSHPYWVLNFCCPIFPAVVNITFNISVP